MRLVVLQPTFFQHVSHLCCSIFFQVLGLVCWDTLLSLPCTLPAQKSVWLCNHVAIIWLCCSLGESGLFWQTCHRISVGGPFITVLGNGGLAVGFCGIPPEFVLSDKAWSFLSLFQLVWELRGSFRHLDQRLRNGGREGSGGERRREDEEEFKREVGEGGINVKDGPSLWAGCSRGCGQVRRMFLRI